jgi:hypothetical protein
MFHINKDQILRLPYNYKVQNMKPPSSWPGEPSSMLPSLSEASLPDAEAELQCQLFHELREDNVRRKTSQLSCNEFHFI